MEDRVQLVPRAGVEPARPRGHRFLRPTRLPVPPPRRGRNGARQYHWPVRIAFALGLSMILSACSLTAALPSTTPVAGTTDTPLQRASAPRITPPPVTPPAPPGTYMPAFKCADATGGSVGVANLTGVRLAEQIGYDRLVLQFDSRVPSYTAKRQAKPIFKASGSGQSVTLSGAAGMLVQIIPLPPPPIADPPTSPTRITRFWWRPRSSRISRATCRGDWG